MSESSAPKPPNRPSPDWPLLLAALLPLLILAGLASMTLAWVSGLAALQPQAHILREQAAAAFAKPADWQTESRFISGLDGLDWQQAYLRDHAGARKWQQDMPGAAGQGWPRPQPLHLALDADTDLVLVPAALPPPARSALIKSVTYKTLALFGLALALALLGYALLQRRLQLLANWTQRLEQGALTIRPPLRTGLLGRSAADIAALAQRLRYSREALQQHASPAGQQLLGRLQQAEARAGTLAQQLERERSAPGARLASGIGHELRTPLTAILGFSELLEKSELDLQQRQYLQSVRRSAQGLLTLISDLLDLERIDAGRLEVHTASFNLNDVVEDTLSLMAPLAYEKQLDLLRIVDHDLPARLLGDAMRIRQVLTNLVSNAIKFTDSGEVMVRASRDTPCDERVWVRLEVEDTGIGLSEQQQAELFEAYRRLDESEERGGSGLGLNIVKRLTDLMHGRIEVRSEPGRGSCFSVRLPLQEDPEAALRSDWEALKQRSAWILNSRSGSWRALQHLLRFWQLELRHFDSPGEMQRTLKNVSKQRLPDLILVCLTAEEVGDLPIARLLSLANERQVPVGCMLNSIDSGVYQQLRDLGANTVMPESGDRSRLYRECCELLSARGDSQSSALQDVPFLVAENNRASSQFLKALLTSLGARVELVENGAQAVAQLHQHSPRFVLLDQNMPELTGIETTRAIRALPNGRDAVIIGMPAFVNREQERSWHDAGLDALLPKPFDEDQLLRCLHPWLRHPASHASPPQAQLGQKLLEDPDLCQLIITELPQQMQDLDEAYIAGKPQACRDAAHQLHGTAAFYHLQPLKSHVQRLEKRLNDIEDIGRYPWLRDDMADVAQAVREVVQALEQRQTA